MLIVVTIIIILYLLIRFSGSKTTFNLRKEKEAFLQRERQANVTRKKDLSGLNYINIPIDTLPFIATEDSELKAIQNTVKELADKKILNLTGLSNTDLKLEYGTANITFLSQCDGNFTLLAKTLYKWALWLHDHAMENEALSVLEFGIQCNTDVSKHYFLLAEHYIKYNQKEKIKTLIQTAEGIKSLSKDNIIKYLKELQS
ncbi:hypothetical protein acsn021_02230 [Anaerocolumna cellulosilytica]|uniref:Uncharacterized protein n=1 Tax=Anaerocolumna cellulosilytica TaxID=433286 RepID=A0A6S6QQ08_9FIRM|nr:hypothetical protein [Anaerocolumna cellulosilytica]MBB5196947.1 hypothetical protein [Anaerocolumna cellulosilytica]BCJ92654.1 hypothetical protein acsn021_02230 [Anaerocolumna cellulosilytica]